jgi:hypothetical protein
MEETEKKCHTGPRDFSQQIRSGTWRNVTKRVHGLMFQTGCSVYWQPVILPHASTIHSRPRWPTCPPPPAHAAIAEAGCTVVALGYEMALKPPFIRSLAALLT